MKNKVPDEVICIGTFFKSSDLYQKFKYLLQSLQIIRNKYSIMICSGTPIPEDLYDLFDFLVYDSKNELLSDPIYLPMMTYNPSSVNFSIVSSFFQKRKNTHLPARWKMHQSIIFSKLSGFKILHFIEFDTEINNLSAFLESLETSSKEIKKSGYSMVNFCKGYIQVPISLNLDLDFPEDWFKYNIYSETEKNKIVEKKKIGGAETEKIVYGDFEDFFGSGSILNLSKDLYKNNVFGYHLYENCLLDNYFAIYFDRAKDNIGFFIGVNGPGVFSSSLEIWVNGESIYSVTPEDRLSGWIDIPLIYKIEDLSEIRYLLDGDERIYNFSSREDLEVFKINSYKYYFN